MPSTCTVWRRSCIKATELKVSSSGNSELLLAKDGCLRNGGKFDDGSNGRVGRRVAANIVASKCKGGNQHQAAKDDWRILGNDAAGFI